MKKKILFTGNGRVVIEDLMGHVADAYECYKCAPLELDFLQALENYKPDTLVVALLDESATALRMYADLKDRLEYNHLPVIAIGNEDSCGTFRRNVFQKNMDCFVRPINMELFLKQLKAFSVLLEDSNPVSDYLAEKMDSFKKEGMKMRAEIENPQSSIQNKINQMTMEANRKSVLIIDDDVRMLNVIKAYLEELYDVTVVPSGKLALKYLSKKHADLVLLDYIMPEMDGPAVLKSIREGNDCPDIPVIFLTGVSDRNMVMKGLEQMPNGYILKPAKKETILERVTEIMLGL